MFRAPMLVVNSVTVRMVRVILLLEKNSMLPVFCGAVPKWAFFAQESQEIESVVMRILIGLGLQNTIKTKRMRLVRVYFRLFVFVIGIVLATELSAQELIVYDAPGGLKYSAHNDDYTVKVRVPGGEWKDLFEYEVEVDLDTRQKASMVSFDFSGEVEVYIRKNNGSIQDVRVRPQSFNIVPEVNGQVIGFKLDEAKKLSVEFNGDRLHNLHVFANSIMMDKPKPKDEDVIYFGPGIHQPGDQPGDVFHVASGKTVFIDGGAVVKAKFMIDKAHDVKILGHGIVWQPERGVEIRHSKNITIDGPIFVNPRHYTIYGGQTTGLTVRNIKSFSSGG